MGDWFTIGAGLAGGLGSAVGKIGQRQREDRQMNRQKELMDKQMKNQMMLNQQGKDLSYQQWLDTNYGAQVEQMEKAGLNPGLMYGGSGAGGTTQSGSGGGASGGSAPQVQNLPMDIGSALASAKLGKDLAILEEQRKNIAADTELKEVEANKKKTVDSELVSAQIGLIAEQTQNEGAKRRLINAQEAGQSIENYINDTTKDDQTKEIQYQARQAVSNANIAANEDKKLRETVNEQITELKANSIAAVLNNQAIITGINLDKAKMMEMANSIEQKWHGVSQQWISVGQKEKEVLIKKFESELKAEYPSMQGVIGNSLMSTLDLFGTLDRKMYGTEPRLKKPY